ncbi:hypothetical protein BpHYR1_042505 [Brachionus plicatilis]|uniref:Uncharacterized protein n=1 Tax=Brachionus plicatilis TaxID=10195 RepID=A0A3M7SX45_BRAPC|nr:hypothetical protein BpHYR1_042505 [Brachionus plicatilis]
MIIDSQNELIIQVNQESIQIMKKTDHFGKVKKKGSNYGRDLKIRQIDLKLLSSSLFALSLCSIKRNKKYTQKNYLNNQNFKLIPINNRRFRKKMHSTNRINNYYSMKCK